MVSRLCDDGVQGRDGRCVENSSCFQIFLFVPVCILLLGSPAGLISYLYVFLYIYPFHFFFLIFSFPLPFPIPSFPSNIPFLLFSSRSVAYRRSRIPIPKGKRVASCRGLRSITAIENPTPKMFRYVSINNSSDPSIQRRNMA